MSDFTVHFIAGFCHTSRMVYLGFCPSTPGLALEIKDALRSDYGVHCLMFQSLISRPWRVQAMVCSP